MFRTALASTCSLDELPTALPAKEVTRVVFAWLLKLGGRKRAPTATPDWFPLERSWSSTNPLELGSEGEITLTIREGIRGGGGVADELIGEDSFSELLGLRLGANDSLRGDDKEGKPLADNRRVGVADSLVLSLSLKISEELAVGVSLILGEGVSDPLSLRLEEGVRESPKEGILEALSILLGDGVAESAGIMLGE